MSIINPTAQPSESICPECRVAVPSNSLAVRNDGSDGPCRLCRFRSLLAAAGDELTTSDFLLLAEALGCAPSVLLAAWAAGTIGEVNR